MGYDGSPAANAAVGVGALLFPGAHAWIVYLWTPPFAREDLRRRLWTGTSHVNEFVEAIEREGRWEAEQIAAVGTTLGRAAGWGAESLVERSYGGEGFRVAQLALELDPDVVLVGSRGLGGAKAVLGSVSDMVVHYSPKPVLVAAHPLLTAEHAALATGPVLIGWDGSAGAHGALTAVERLFPTRDLLLVSVNADGTTDDLDSYTGSNNDRQVVRLSVDSQHGTSSRAVADTLAGLARERHAALVAVGSRGRTAIREILLGSVAMATLHRASRPVLVVPSAERGSA
ncbi:universal stress protein [Nonomuraea aurantiaca]|uniref:universal stress protein n=1 Tax=Nonomuraea aurantiaca TaxID=2878562 RepID=UPI0021E66384|nr:universal stress protein [Nonomuraea aurantiaca]